MANTGSAKITITEKDLSNYNINEATTVASIVGFATKGPINTPTLCSSKGDFIDKFGEPPLSSPWGHLAAFRYFNSGNALYYVRAAAMPDDDETASDANNDYEGAYATYFETNNIAIGAKIVSDSAVLTSWSDGTYKIGMRYYSGTGSEPTTDTQIMIQIIGGPIVLSGAGGVIEKLQTAIDNAFGAGEISVALQSGSTDILEFITNETGENVYLKITNGENDDALEYYGFTEEKLKYGANSTPQYLTVYDGIKTAASVESETALTFPITGTQLTYATGDMTVDSVPTTAIQAVGDITFGANAEIGDTIEISNGTMIETYEFGTGTDDDTSYHYYITVGVDSDTSATNLFNKINSKSVLCSATNGTASKVDLTVLKAGSLGNSYTITITEVTGTDLSKTDFATGADGTRFQLSGVDFEFVNDTDNSDNYIAIDINGLGTAADVANQMITDIEASSVNDSVNVEINGSVAEQIDVEAKLAGATGNSITLVVDGVEITTTNSGTLENGTDQTKYGIDITLTEQGNASISKNIQIEPTTDIADMAGLISLIQTKLNSKFGIDKINVSEETTDKLTFITESTGANTIITLAEPSQYSGWTEFGFTSSTAISSVGTDGTRTGEVKVSFKELGTGGDNYGVRFTERPGVIDPTIFTYKLEVIKNDDIDNPVETWPQISFDSSDINYWIDKINSEDSGSDFITALAGTGTVGNIDFSDTPSFVMPKINNNTTNKLYKFSNGDDGIPESNDLNGIHDYGTIIDSLIKEALASLKNKDTIEFDLLAIPGYYSNETINNGINLVENRKDFFYIIDSPNGYTYKQVTDWHNGVDVDGSPNSLLDTSYGATFWPWQTDRNYYDNAINSDGELVNCPATGFILEAMVRTDSAYNAQWLAAAGIPEGLIFPEDYETSPNQEERDYMYSDLNAVNPIFFKVGQGSLIWGNKTLLREYSALNQINVRRLVILIRKRVRNAMQEFIFKQNNATTWNKAETIVTNILEPIREAGGLEDYQVRFDETTTTDKNIDELVMNGTIAIKPTKAISYINVGINIIGATGSVDVFEL